MKEIPCFLTMGGVKFWHTITNNLPTVSTAKKKATKETIVKNHNIREQCGRNAETKKNMEGQSRYPLYDTGTQRRKEGGDQQQERTQENEAERINAGCPDQEGFTIEKHRKKNVKGRRCHPKNS